MAPSLDKIRKHPRIKDKDDYQELLETTQWRMLRVQQKIHREERRAIILFQGWDAGGKGGAIKRLVETVDPRGVHVHPIGAPRPDEQGRHYLWRFWIRVPEPGIIAIFDRSWYGRVLVERVEKLAPKSAWKRAYDEINDFERMMVNDGCPVLKFFLHISADEQLDRFREREKNPYKRWKIGPDDWRNRKKRKKYEKAIGEMFKRTHTREAPWHLVAADHKWHARTEVLRLTVESLEKAFRK